MKILGRIIMTKVMKDIFGVDVPYSQKLHELHNDFPFLPERKKKIYKSLLLIYMMKINMSFTTEI